MRKRRFIGMALFGMVALSIYAQRDIISAGSVENRARIVGEMPRDPEKEEAVMFAGQYGIPVREIDNLGRVKEIRRIDHSRQPLYYSTHNLNAAKTVSTNKLWSGTIEGLNLRGKNILVAVWDGGKIRTTHSEFGTRAYSLDSGFEIVGHATHVAGTIGATGLQGNSRGMANLSYIEGYDWDNDNSEMRQAAGDGLLISNHSYGFIHGFDYNSSENRWEWYGDIDIDEEEDYKFGFYGSDARTWDDIAYDNPYYMIVKSAGNDRLEGPGAGGEHYVFDNGWKASNKVRDKDGGPGGFDCIGTQGSSKNILTVGAVRDVENGYSVPEDVVMTDFSTFGPTDDGRIKPDIVGNGHNLYSAYYNNDNDYTTLSGTSMASPNVAGSLALLQELYFKKHKGYMKSATLKALALHSADDAGNPGPDYKFGWGLLNTFAAARLISIDNKLIIEDSITDQSVRVHRIYSAGDTTIRITACWTDPSGPIVGPALDPKDIILVNDLDIRLIKLNDSTIYPPYILTPENPDAPAQTGDNFRDNVEQIYLPASAKGYYDLVVSHKNNLFDSLQHFSLVIEGVTKVFVAKDSTYLEGNNGFLQVTDAPEYPLDDRFVWLIEPQNQQPVTFRFTDFNTDTGDYVFIYDGNNRSAPLLGRFSGNLSNPDTLLFSSGGSLFIEFKSGQQGGFNGFSSRYCTVPPEEVITLLGEKNPCFNSEEIYIFTPLPESEYAWNLTDNIKDSAILHLTSAYLKIPDNPFTLGITPYNRCGDGTTTERIITPLLSPPVLDNAIMGDTVPCTNAQNLFRAGYDPTATYRWILPEGWKGRSDSASILVTPKKATGSITVFPGNSCGESEGITLEVQPLALPRIPVIASDRISPCEKSLQEFFILSEGDVAYSWDVETGWEVVGPDTLNRVSVLIGSGTAGRMYLTASNKCGDTITSRNFLLSPSPVQPDLNLQPSFIDGLDEIVIRNYSDYDQVNWFRNDSIITDFEGETLILQRNGIYSVDVANSQGCWASTEVSNQIQISKASLAFNISTGSGGIIKIENDSRQEATINVYDLTGRIVFSNVVQPGTNFYHTARRGLLIFNIEGASQVKTQLVFVN